jgi:hypothetical protein
MRHSEEARAGDCPGFSFSAPSPAQHGTYAETTASDLTR